ncbi:MAG: hypothetical protein ABH873_06370 [Candidatus Firestonebacteria bacterium]
MRKKITEIKYLNTDLNLKSSTSFKELNDFLSRDGSFVLHYEKIKDEKHSGTYEIEIDSTSPDKTIKKFLKKLSKMDKICKKQWDECSLKEFDIGYECGQKPWAFNNEIKNTVLKELAKLNLGIRITIYPPLITKQSSGL